MKYANIAHAKCSEAHTWLTKPKHETDGKEHSESPNEQQSKYSAANLSAHVNKTCIELPLGTLPCFTFHTTFWVYNKYNGGFGRSDKLTERQRSCSLSLTSNDFLTVSTAGVGGGQRWGLSRVTFHKLLLMAIWSVHPWTFILQPQRSKSRSEFQGNEGPSTLGRTFIDVSLSFDRLLFNLSGISGELFEHFESAVDSLIKYARLTAMTNLCRRHFTAACWEPLCTNPS